MREIYLCVFNESQRSTSSVNHRMEKGLDLIPFIKVLFEDAIELE